MRIQRINRTDPEKVFIVVKNDEASAAFVAGGPVVLQADGTDDGLAAVKLVTGTAAKASLLLGVADAATAAGAVGLVQCYRERTDAVINKAGTATNANGAIGDVLIPWTASDAFSGVAAGAATGFSPWAILMLTVASSGVADDDGCRKHPFPIQRLEKDPSDPPCADEPHRLNLHETVPPSRFPG